MAYKEFTLGNNLPIKIYKKRTSKSLRLSITHSGSVKLTIPAWASYKAGLDFARSKEDWLSKQVPAQNILSDNLPIGKAHHLVFSYSEKSTKPASRIAGNKIVITLPSGYAINDTLVQEVAAKACVRALRSQAEKLLPQRLDYLASKYNFEYSSVRIKMLKGRWGSCDHQKNIVLNLFLMQLPWENIDYVLLHELTHTIVLKHGPDFWSSMERILPNVKAIKKELRKHKPVVNGTIVQAVA